MIREDGRKFDQLREVKITPSYIKYADGSSLIEIGNTKVICTASVEEKVPPHIYGTGQGWITAEYGMLPRSTSTRQQREVTRGKPHGRTAEIQRLIGRSLRSVVDLKSLGEITIWIDCDVIQADGGTRCASIVGAFIALVEALAKLQDAGKIKTWPVKDILSAVSCGIVHGAILLDLNYSEDSSAEVDMNIVMTATGKLVEVQITGEKRPFTQDEMEKLIILSKVGIAALSEKQKEVLKIFEKNN